MFDYISVVPTYNWIRNAISCPRPLLPRGTGLPTWPPEDMLCLLKAPSTSLWSCQNCLLSLNNPGVSSSALLVVNRPSRAILRGSKCVTIIVHSTVTSGLEITSRSFTAFMQVYLYVCACVTEVLGASVYCNAKDSAFSGYPSAAFSWAPHHGFPGHMHCKFSHSATRMRSRRQREKGTSEECLALAIKNRHWFLLFLINLWHKCELYKPSTLFSGFSPEAAYATFLHYILTVSNLSSALHREKIVLKTSLLFFKFHSSAWTIFEVLFEPNKFNSIRVD